MSSNASKLIQTVSAAILDSAGRMLLVRKRGSEILIQPGGKPEAGEAALGALARELDEELGVAMDPETAVRLGQFEDDAVHEAGWRIRTETWLVDVAGTPAPQAEIAELFWINLNPPGPENIAPLSRRHIIPAVFEWQQTLDSPVREHTG